MVVPAKKGEDVPRLRPAAVDRHVLAGTQEAGMVAAAVQCPMVVGMQGLGADAEAVGFATHFVERHQKQQNAPLSAG